MPSDRSLHLKNNWLEHGAIITDGAFINGGVAALFKEEGIFNHVATLLCSPTKDAPLADADAQGLAAGGGSGSQAEAEEAGAEGGEEYDLSKITPPPKRLRRAPMAPASKDASRAGMPP